MAFGRGIKQFLVLSFKRILNLIKFSKRHHKDSAITLADCHCVSAFVLTNTDPLRNEVAVSEVAALSVLNESSHARFVQDTHVRVLFAVPFLLLLNMVYKLLICNEIYCIDV